MAGAGPAKAFVGLAPIPTFPQWGKENCRRAVGVPTAALLQRLPLWRKAGMGALTHLTHASRLTLAP